MNTFYIDPTAGDDASDGLSPERPWKTYATREFSGGDSVLFKRGTVIRDILHAHNGRAGAPVTYGAYGEGDRPVFLGSVPANDPACWVEERPSIWRYTGTLPSEVCNLIFNGGESCGVLRWQVEDLANPGEWHYTGIGATSGGEDRNGVLYLYAPAHPALAYRGIECALWGQRKLIGGERHIVVENLSFRNSGVHGYQGVDARDITIRDCDFRFIGGAVWHRERRIRFGNAIEMWDGASNVTVERCLFDTIYDSGVTHQGGETRNIPERLYFRDNLFIDCGMSAYECREPSQEIYFEYNTCIITGGGFGLQADGLPRQSEIYPQPMGHHVFIWRVEPHTQPGHVFIRHNIFDRAPFGAAIYSIIDPVDEGQFILDHNAYWQPADELLIHFGGKSYVTAAFSHYQAECGQDNNSLIAQPRYVDEDNGDFRQRDESPCRGIGLQSDVRRY